MTYYEVGEYNHLPPLFVCEVFRNKGKMSLKYNQGVLLRNCKNNKLGDLIVPNNIKLK